MVLQWLTFAVMILIQAVAAGVIISAIRTTLEQHGQEIKSLRDWRHSFGPKEMVYDAMGAEVKEHEARLRAMEVRRAMECTAPDCPIRSNLER